MNRFLGTLVLCSALLLTGCAHQVPAEEPEDTLPAVTVSADGDPHTVTCLGSYTGTGSMDTIVARMEGAALTNEELQIWYRAEIAQYRQEGISPGPDFSLPLDVQPCPVDGSVNNWQQYFLKAALNRWHTAQALIRHSQETPLPLEDAYRGNPELLDKYMAEMPVTKLLYGYHPYYSPNSLHQQYLDALPERMDGQLAQAAYTLNYGYMYFTSLSYELEAEDAAVAEEGQSLVSFRHILLLPQEGESLSDCVGRANALLETWLQDRNAGEASFAQLANRNSQDPGSVQNGGLYRNLGREQLPEELGQWCFAEARQEGDTFLLPTDYGVHILYFLSREDSAPVHARQASRTQAQHKLLKDIRELYPARIDYRHIVLSEGVSDVSLSDLLYPDVAHQRFPEVPLYLQQNYIGTMYGDYKLTTNGCGITCLAMLASYMTDQELTPPEMAARYGRYSRPTGTAGSLFSEVPQQLGFYLIKKSYDWREAREYMQEGHPVIVCQYRGYWTSGGHYLVLEKLTEDGMVQVRDSNMANYRRLPRHKEDKFPWDTLSSAGHGYWIYEKKATVSPACTRCGDPDSLEIRIVTDYLCENCQNALTRRSNYLSCHWSEG